MKPFLKELFQQKIEINYLYFSFLLLFLTTLTLIHYLTREQPLLGFSLLYFSYALIQAFFEVSLFVLAAHMLKRWTPSWSYFAFISLSGILALLHFTQFTLVRLVDAPLTFAFKLLFGAGMEQWVHAFRALNMSHAMAALIFGAFLAIPFAGLILHRLTLPLSKAMPLCLSLLQILSTLCLTGASLFLVEVSMSPFVSPQIYQKYQKTLPLGGTFMSPSPTHLSLSTPFPSLREEAEVLSQIPPLAASDKPNIYLFVIETLRKDYLDAAPHLSAFGQKHISPAHSYANANSTHLSWFSIFQSILPFHWTSMRDRWKQGSIPLQILKKLGYQIEVYSSAELSYFNMDQLIFGQERKLLDRCTETFSHRNLQPCDRDALVIQSLEQNLKSDGHLYIIFLDSTHSEYSFPHDFPLKYQPIAQEIDYLTIGPQSAQLEPIKNRYRNAIAYVDHLVHRFFETLKTKGLYEEGIIAITADHGEEFFEEGALFHGTHINEYQTSVPLFFKFPSADWIPQTDEMTHIDLFPTLLHYLTKESHFSSLFDGRSIFGQERPPFRVAVLQNGSFPPIEFTLKKTDFSCRARFIDPSTLEIVQLQGFLESGMLSPSFTENYDSSH